jgi:hypothetical protein
MLPAPVPASISNVLGLVAPHVLIALLDPILIVHLYIIMHLLLTTAYSALRIVVLQVAAVH